MLLFIFFFLPISLQALSLQEGGFFQDLTLFKPLISAIVVVLHVPNEGGAPERTSVSIAFLFCFVCFFNKDPSRGPTSAEQGQISHRLMVIGVIGCRALTYINKYKSQVRSRGSEQGVRANLRGPDGDPEILVLGPVFKFKRSHNLAGSSAQLEKGGQK